MASTTTSARLATSTASAILRRSSSGSLGVDVVLLPGAADGDLAAFVVEHFDVGADALADAFEHRRAVLRLAAVAAEQFAVGVRADDGDRLELRDVERQQRRRRS